MFDKEIKDLTTEERLGLLAISQARLITTSNNQLRLIARLTDNFNELTRKVTYITNAYEVVQDDLKLANSKIKSLELEEAEQYRLLGIQASGIEKLNARISALELANMKTFGDRK
jgi:hypothetical protein